MPPADWTDAGGWEAPAPRAIVLLRAALNLTQGELAAKLAVSQATVSRWERGETRPRRPAAGRLRRILSEERTREADHPVRGAADHDPLADP